MIRGCSKQAVCEQLVFSWHSNSFIHIYKGELHTNSINSVAEFGNSGAQKPDPDVLQKEMLQKLY